MRCCACPWASSTSTTCSPTSSRPWPPPLADPPPRPHRRTPHDQPVPLSHPSSHPRRRRGGHRRPAGRLQQRRERLHGGSGGSGGEDVLARIQESGTVRIGVEGTYR